MIALICGAKRKSMDETDRPKSAAALESMPRRRVLDVT
jgi:hypothetical protein